MSFFASLRNRIILVVAVSCVICTVIAVSVARHFAVSERYEGIIDKSRTIHSRLDAATEYVAHQGGLKPIIEKYATKYNDPSQLSKEERLDVLKQVPIYAAMEIGAKNAKTEGYQFRVFSPEPRRKENKATPDEMTVFQQFLNDPRLSEITTNNDGIISVYRPIRLSQANGCLHCHGDPATSPWKNGKDILGFKMENWPDGKLHGVFAVISDTDAIRAIEARSKVMSQDQQIGLFNIGGAIIAIAFAIFIIRGPLGGVKNVSDRLATSSTEIGSAVSQIFSIAQVLSTASLEQAAAVQETAASIEEISAMATRSAENAADSERACSQSIASAEKGRQVVSQMVTSMSEINQSNDSVVSAVGASNERFTEIVRVIEEIRSKTNVINDIVFQTKLLSFNASVEAARAGEHGKGFAVVAEEVGNLAQMSGNAAKEISGLLEESKRRVESIVVETKTTVDQIIASAKMTVARGADVARECEQVLSEVVESSTNVASLVSSIATASQEQARGVAEISKAVQSIDQSTQVNSTSAESCAATAEHLAAKIKDLRSASTTLRLTVDGVSTVMRFRWGDEYLLGVDAMDEEHKILIEKMNRLAECLEGEQDEKGRASMRTAFADMVAYTKEHFADEEAYLEEIGFPELQAHQRLHVDLLARVGEFSADVENGRVDGAKLMNFINDWLMRHILGTDKKYAHYGRKHGIDGHASANPATMRRSA